MIEELKFVLGETPIHEVEIKTVEKINEIIKALNEIQAGSKSVEKDEK